MISGQTLKSKDLRGPIEIAVIVIVAILVAVIVRTFLLQLFYIPSESMDPTLKKSDKIFVNKLSYKFHEVDRGDIIVFKAPKVVYDNSVLQHKADPRNPIIKDLVKRVVGLPGESIEGKCSNGAQICELDLFVNGKKLNEPYLVPGIQNAPFSTGEIPADSYFVMGDNRDGSEDSRVFGTIKENTVIGRAFFRLWPASNFGFL